MPIAKKATALVLLAVAGLGLTVYSADDYVIGFKGTENLAFDGLGKLFVTDTDHLWKVDLDKNLHIVYTRDPQTDGISMGGVAAGPAADVYFSAGNRILRLDQDSGEISEVASGFDFINGLCFDQEGNLYAADSNAKKIFALPAKTREKKVIVDDGSWVNGLVFHPELNLLYYTVSSPGKVVAVEVAPATLQIKNTRTVINMPLSGLDDLTLDENGNIYVCAWLNGKIVRVSPEGKKELVVKNVDGPSAAAFGVLDDRDVLYVCVKGGNARFEGDKIIALSLDISGLKEPLVP